MTRPRKRLLIAAAVTAAVVAIAAGLWWRWDTQRQPQVTDVLTAMNTAVADTVVAAGQDAAVTVSPVVRSADCELGPLRTGGIFTGKADLYVDPGSEDALITTVEQNLAGRYATTRAPAAAGVRALRADTADGISLSVRKLSPGWLTVTARSGCSLGTGGRPGPAGDAVAGTGALTTLLERLGTRPRAFTEQRVRCATGDIVTISTLSQSADTRRLGDRLAGAVPAGARVFATGDANRISYREGPVSVVVAASDDGTAVSAQHTTVC